jgi:hypothetical protein
MFAILHVLWIFVVDIFKSRRRLEAENLFLHHQLNIALRRAPPRLRLYGSDRALLVWMTRIWPGLLDISRVVKPETILRWHRSGFTAFWRWKSRNRAGRPKVDRELRDLIRRMSKENPLWGAPRIHGELLMLGFEVAQSTVSKYMVRGRTPPSQSWRTFLRNHMEVIAAIDMPRARHCRDGSIHCPDHWLQPALCLRRCSAEPERAGLDQRYTKSYGRMDRAPDNRGIPLE